MDALEYAIAKRAEGAVAMLLQGKPSNPARAKAFVEAARLIAKATDEVSAMSALQRSQNEMVAKVFAHTTLNSGWSEPDGQQLAAGFIASVPEPDLLTLIMRYARVMPRAMTNVLIATGISGNTAAEGFPKVIRRLDLSHGALDFTKSLAVIVVTKELLNNTGDEGRGLFEAELARAVIRAANGAILATLVDSNTTQVAAGADPLASLRAGLLAAEPSAGYAVTAPPGWVAWLASHEASRGMGVRGGTFAPGIEILAVDDATAMHVIPCSRLAVWDGGLELRPAGHATVDMSDSPQVSGSKVSLWQTNSVGLLAERHWRIDGDTSGVVKVGS